MLPYCLIRFASYLKTTCTCHIPSGLWLIWLMFCLLQSREYIGKSDPFFSSRHPKQAKTLSGQGMWKQSWEKVSIWFMLFDKHFTEKSFIWINRWIKLRHDGKVLLGLHEVHRLHHHVCCICKFFPILFSICRNCHNLALMSYLVLKLFLFYYKRRC